MLRSHPTQRLHAHPTRRFRWVAAVTVALLGVLGLPGLASAQAPEPVLGVPGLYGEFGEGWGTAHPERIFNGGSPSGLASGVAWQAWGSPSALGTGQIALYRPEGGYYDAPGAIELRASALGSCANAPAQPAYTRLMARIPQRPGGKLGDWFPWTLDLCDPEARATACRSVTFIKNSGSGAFEATAWDTGCATARKVAKASRRVPIRFGGKDLHKYRFRAFGFACNGYSFDSDELPSISWTCTRNTKVVTFTRG